jgi:hypothetical protein
MDQRTENFYAMRGQWLDYLVERRDFTHGDFRVAYFIASKINPIDGCMWWGVGTIAEELQVSIRTVTSATDKLAHAGLLVITKGRKGMNYYYMRMPLDPAGAAFSALREKRKKTGGRTSRVSKNETVRVSKNET